MTSCVVENNALVTWCVTGPLHFHANATQPTELQYRRGWLYTEWLKQKCKRCFMRCVQTLQRHFKVNVVLRNLLYYPLFFFPLWWTVCNFLNRKLQIFLAIFGVTHGFKIFFIFGYFFYIITNPLEVTGTSIFCKFEHFPETIFLIFQK